MAGGNFLTSVFKSVISSGNADPADHPDPCEEKSGTDTGSWEHGTGEGSASALHRMKHQQRSRSEVSPCPEDGPSTT